MEQNTLNTNEEIVKIALESKDFDNRIDEAVPHRIKINTDLRNEMRNVKERFVNLIIKADPEIAKLVGTRVKDEGAREKLKAAKRDAVEKFNIVKHIVHPNEGVKDPWRIKNIIQAFRILDFINSADSVKEELNDNGISLTNNEPINQENPYFDDNIRGELQAIVSDMDAVQGEICENADQIKKTIYDNIEEDIRKSKKNKNGISKSQFQKIVLTKANKQIQDNAKFETFRDKIANNESHDITSKKIVAEKVKTF